MTFKIQPQLFSLSSSFEYSITSDRLFLHYCLGWVQPALLNRFSSVQLELSWISHCAGLRCSLHHFSCWKTSVVSHLMHIYILFTWTLYKESLTSSSKHDVLEWTRNNKKPFRYPKLPASLDEQRMLVNLLFPKAPSSGSKAFRTWMKQIKLSIRRNSISIN